MHAVFPVRQLPTLLGRTSIIRLVRGPMSLPIHPKLHTHCTCHIVIDPYFLNLHRPYLSDIDEERSETQVSAGPSSRITAGSPGPQNSGKLRTIRIPPMQPSKPATQTANEVAHSPTLSRPKGVPTRVTRSVTKDAVHLLVSPMDDTSNGPVHRNRRTEIEHESQRADTPRASNVRKPASPNSLAAQNEPPGRNSSLASTSGATPDPARKLSLPAQATTSPTDSVTLAVSPPVSYSYDLARFSSGMKVPAAATARWGHTMPPQWLPYEQSISQHSRRAHTVEHEAAPTLTPGLYSSMARASGPNPDVRRLCSRLTTSEPGSPMRVTAAQSTLAAGTVEPTDVRRKEPPHIAAISVAASTTPPATSTRVPLASSNMGSRQLVAATVPTLRAADFGAPVPRWPAYLTRRSTQESETEVEAMLSATGSHLSGVAHRSLDGSYASPAKLKSEGTKPDLMLDREKGASSKKLVSGKDALAQEERQAVVQSPGKRRKVDESWQ